MQKGPEIVMYVDGRDLVIGRQNLNVTLKNIYFLLSVKLKQFPYCNLT